MTTSRPARLPLVVAGMVLAAGLGFAAFTGHAWEDYFITFRSSLNLATGHGLVFQPGERVHTFTSPLGTLLPALFAVGGGDDVAGRALWCFRIVSLLALGAAGFVATRAMLRAGLAPAAVAGAAMLWLLDPKVIDFSINGQEAALVILFVVLAWRALADGAPLWPSALACTGLQWTRPDGGVFFAALGLAWLCFGRRPETWPRRFAALVRAIALAVALYLPWLVFTWIYYGTPVPHTVLAKPSHYAAAEILPALASYPWRLLFGHVAAHGLFQPTYFFFGGWPEWLGGWSRLLATGAALAWLVPGLRPAGRIASFAFFLGGWYVEYIPRSPWYYPAWQTLGCLAWAWLLQRGLEVTRFRVVPSLARIGAGTMALITIALLGGAALEMRAQQRIIENGHRREIGRWLRGQAARGDRVYLEPLGYIGYFSQLKMLDHPGLSSPEVVAARRAGARTHAAVIAALRPEWLVLRPDQVAAIEADQPALLREGYRVARIFDVREAVEAEPVLPGRPYLLFDAVFVVFRRP